MSFRVKIPYLDQLNDVRWLRRRDEILKAHDWVCHECGSNAPPAREVHHRYYIVGRYAWEYPDSAMVPLCSRHHKAVHDAEHEGEMMAWEKMITQILADVWMPAGADTICEFCKMPFPENTNGGKAGRHRFICEPCAKKSEEARVLPL